MGDLCRGEGEVLVPLSSKSKVQVQVRIPDPFTSPRLAKEPRERHNVLPLNCADLPHHVSSIMTIVIVTELVL
jgi:hypothetical protein